MTALPTWDLKDFYDSYKSKKISKDILSLDKLAKKFSNLYKNKLKVISSKELVKSLFDYEKLEEKISHIKSFAFLTHCTDQLNKDKTKFFQFIQEKMSDIEKNTIFYTIEINKLSKKKLSHLINTKDASRVLNLNKIKKY